MKKAVKVKTEEQKDLEMRQDIFWRNFYFMIFLAAITSGFLEKWHLETTTVTFILIGLWLAGVLFLPSWWYKQNWIREQYDIFQNKKWQTATDEKERARAKVYYNFAVFFMLSVFVWLGSGALTEFVFNKNKTIGTIVEVVLMTSALVFSIWLTEKKSKQPKQSE